MDDGLRRERLAVTAVDVAASAVARLAPRPFSRGIDQLRMDVHALLDGLRGRRMPVSRRPGNSFPSRVPLEDIDPLAHVLAWPRRPSAAGPAPRPAHVGASSADTAPRDTAPRDTAPRRRAIRAPRGGRPDGHARPEVKRTAEPGTHQASVNLRGVEVRFSVYPTQTLLAAGLAAGVPMPFSCTLGGCGACRMQLRRGRVVMDEPNCLSAKERAAGVVLTCCGRPLGDVSLERQP